MPLVQVEVLHIFEYKTHNFCTFSFQGQLSEECIHSLTASVKELQSPMICDQIKTKRLFKVNRMKCDVKEIC